MHKAAEKSVGSLLNVLPVPDISLDRIGRKLVENKYHVLYVAGAIVVSFAILKMLENPWYMKKFQLSDFTEA